MRVHNNNISSALAFMTRWTLGNGAAMKWFIRAADATRRGTTVQDPASCLWALYHRATQRTSWPVLGRDSVWRRGRAPCRRDRGMHVLARVYVTKLMVGSGVTESIIPAERRRGKKLWFRVHRGSTRDRISEGGWRAKGVWFIGDYGEDIGTYAFCLTFREKPSDESYRLLDRLENTRMALLSVGDVFLFHRLARVSRGDDTRERVNCDRMS